MNHFTKIKNWYYKTFLPYENPEHPLYAPKYQEPELDEWIPDFSYPLSLRRLERKEMDIYEPLKPEYTDEEAIALLKIETLSIEELEDLAWFYCHTQGSPRAPMTEREDILAEALLDRLEEIDPI